MAKVRFKKNVNIGRVVAKLTSTIIALWVGGTIMTVLGETMNATCSPFYKGLTLIGWTVETGTCDGVASTANTITSTSGSGVLAVVGLIGIAAIVLEFVEFNL